jgi:hypothetical protein
MYGNDKGHRFGQLDRKHRSYLVGCRRDGASHSKKRFIGKDRFRDNVRLSWARLGQAMVHITYIYTKQNSKAKKSQYIHTYCDSVSPNMLPFLKLEYNFS